MGVGMRLVVEGVSVRYYAEIGERSNTECGRFFFRVYLGYNSFLFDILLPGRITR